ncbi:Annexin C1 [Fulvia fulva]|uniref:Annexin n=1 Tax=Passalora fulva TaxID=5499 RepID=A0A9Q8P9S2_PASFU|nr:Annexin C1 [Fulvia fulva]KAK4624157.1 Annexin C1 [Fulvia fulva]KAK4624906.1 Annexin C1 [Fulvia fulva]UJO18241.1 Annexin C1 [Fulvia fulva]WPV15614.1 Annexin C1 [Fulvia fulva]WPV30039.1 Annexin C1 [Fulvia fulva]
MSYYPPPGGPPPQGQYGYGGQPPYPPQQGGCPPPMNQQQYPQQGYGQQPPQGYGPPPGQGYGAPYGAPPPQGHSPYLPQGQGYGAPPPGQTPYGQQPPPQAGYGQPPPMGGYGQPPPQQGYGAPAGPPAMPSPGYDLRQRCPADMSHAADECRAAMKGFGTNEDRLIRALASVGPLEIEGLKVAYQQRHKRDLMKDVHSETSGYFREGLEAIIRGPLAQDCHVVKEAIAGAGTKESALDDVLLCRSNADMNAIKAHYQQMHRKSLESDVKGDLSAKTERMYDMVMAARREEESAPVLPQQIDTWVKDIYGATEGRTGTDQLTVCTILTSRSNGQIRAISQAYKQKYHKSLEDVIKKEFSGHMEDALLFMVGAATDPAKHDADRLEQAMAGMGTKDQALVRRIVAIHWDKQRLQQVKAAFKHFYKKDLAARVQSETSGDYKKLMVVLLSS